MISLVIYFIPLRVTGDVGIFSYSMGKRSNDFTDKLLLVLVLALLLIHCLGFDTNLWNRLDDKLKKH